MKTILIHSALAAAALTLLAPTLHAQEWPTRPIRWIVPYQAGSAPDIIARVVGQAMAESLKQPVIVDNKPGAGGNLGAQLAARAPADGYTWVYSAAPMAANMRMYKAPGFDALKDFVHVSRINEADVLLVVQPDSGIHNVKDLIERARKNPGKLNYGSGGIGTPSHLGAELLLSAAGVEALHVPYKGAASAVTALMGKEIDFSLPILQVALPQVQAGKLRALAVTSPRRSPKLPDVPTLVEAGVPGVTLVTFGGVSVPVGTPAPIVARINAAVRQALDRADVGSKFDATGLTPSASTPEQYTSEMKAEIALTEKMMRAAKLEAQ